MLVTRISSYTKDGLRFVSFVDKSNRCSSKVLIAEIVAAKMAARPSSSQGPLVADAAGQKAWVCVFQSILEKAMA